MMDWEALDTPGCEYGVSVNYGPDGIDNCGSLAQYRIWWAEDQSDSMFVCGEHFVVVHNSEEE